MDLLAYVLHSQLNASSDPLPTEDIGLLLRFLRARTRTSPGLVVSLEIDSRCWEGSTAYSLAADGTFVLFSNGERVKVVHF